MIHDDKPDLDAYVLEHYGVKGMKWGVRKQRESSDSSGTPEPKTPLTKEQKRARAKKIAIGTGALLAVAGGAAVAYHLNKNGKLPISSLKKSGKAAAASNSAVKKVLAEPTSVIHASRGKTKGFRFFQQGGTPDYFGQYTKVFENTPGAHQDGFFERLSDGKVAATFNDPHGRKDQSGRVIPHMVLIPSYMSTGFKTTADVVKYLWPTLEGTHIYDDAT